MLQSTNEACNYLQSVLGVFMHSTNTPEKVVETFAHAGLSISTRSIHNATKSLSKEAEKNVRKTMRTLTALLAYDNFDIYFKSSQPVIEHQSRFVSATSATVIPIYGIDDPSVLRCSADLWAADPRNPNSTKLPVDVDDLRDLHDRYDWYFMDPSLPTADNAMLANDKNISPFLQTCMWHIRDILIRHTPQFRHFFPKLGEPKGVNRIPLHKTTQIPCRAMNIKESTIDGNIQVVETLLRRGGVGSPVNATFNPENDVDMSEHIMFVHGDLLTKERLDSVRDSRRIEHDPIDRFDSIHPLPGVFHIEMAATDTFWRIWMELVLPRLSSARLRLDSAT